MVFERAGGRWKLAAAVNHPDGGGWPTLCTQGSPPAGPGALAADSYAPDLARVLTSAMTGSAQTGHFTPAPDSTVALPLADGRGYWLIGILTQSDTYSAPSGVRAKDRPDGNQVATPRPAVVHHESDTFITTYTAIDPPRTADATVVLDGFFGWPLSAVAS